MPAVTLELKKRSDGAAILTFVRADGSRTSSSIGPASGFGPVHDLSHYAVESVLGIARGFIGLCGEGWTVQDFDKDAAKTIPPEAGVAEAVAGQVSNMEITQQWLSFEDFGGVMAVTGFAMTAVHYQMIRRAVARLRTEWSALAPGATMSLRFEPGSAVEVSEEGVIS